MSFSNFSSMKQAASGSVKVKGERSMVKVGGEGYDTRQTHKRHGHKTRQRG